MAAVEVDALYRTLLSELQALLTAARSLPAKRCYISAEPFFDDVNLEFCQIIPGAGRVLDPDSTTGEVAEDFLVAVGGRVRTDNMYEDTRKLTDDTLGIYTFRKQVWGTGFGATPDGLIGLTLTGDLNHAPITLRSWEQARTNPADRAQVMLISRFHWRYQVAHGNSI